MRILPFVFVLGILGLLYACTESSPPGQAHLDIRLTDDPAGYDAVLIDLQAVEVIVEDAGPVMLDVSPGTYDLLDYAAGADTLIATGPVEATRLEQIRLILGPGNFVIVDSVTHPLQTPSAQQSGLKLQVHEDLEPGVTYAFLLDFDACASIVEKGNGDYLLKPVIHVIDTALSGAIRGSVDPVLDGVPVSAVTPADTFSTFTDNTGAFLVQGLPGGTYDLLVTAPPGYTDAMVPGVAVTVGAVTDVGVVGL